MARSQKRHLPIRVEESLHARLVKDAKANKRSLSAEIAHRLEQSYGLQEQFMEQFKRLEQVLVEKAFRDALNNRVDEAVRKAIRELNEYEDGEKS